MAKSNTENLPIPEWFQNAKPGLVLKAVEFFETTPDNPSQFGKKVRVSTVVAGKLHASNGKTVTVAFGAELHGGALMITAHPSKFKPIG